MSTAPNPHFTIRTGSGRVLDQAAFEAEIFAGLTRHERELTLRRAKIKRAVARLRDAALRVKREVMAALKR